MVAEPGTYILLMRAPADREVRIGELGVLTLSDGWLTYVGSALGPGGLRARVGRHLSGGGSLHWHVDYLLRDTSVAEVWWRRGKERCEEAWASALRGAPGASLPLRGFGASDCGCPGHLIGFPDRPSVEDFRRWVGDGDVQATSEFGRR